MRIPVRPCLTLALMLVPATIYAQEATCLSTGSNAEAQQSLTVNDVVARITSQGSLFPNSGAYTIADSQPIYASNIWVGGMVDGRLRISAQTFGTPNFRAGTVEETGSMTEGSPDSLWLLSRGSVELMNRSGYANDEVCSWPWRKGAPVLDGDGVPGNYNLAGGDRPDVRGHQSVWWVMNDIGRWGSVFEPLRMEVRGMAFAARGDEPAIDQTILFRYELTYKGSAPLREAYFSVFADPDLGYAGDDYVGVDSALGLGYVYNASNYDALYGEAPPALGYLLVQGPRAADDRLDNDHDGQTDEADERLPLSAFTYFPGDCSACHPEAPEAFYNYMRGRWWDGEPMRTFSSGYVTGSSEAPVTTFAFSGDPVQGAFWSEVNVNGNGSARLLGDRRFILSVGPFDLEPGETEEVVLAIIWARGDSNLDSITKLRALARAVSQRYTQDGYVFDLAGPPLAPPSAFAVQDGAQDISTTPMLARGSETKMVHQLSEDAGFAQSIAFEGRAPVLAHDRTYFFRSLHYDAVRGASGWSPTGSFTTVKQAPASSAWTIYTTANAGLPGDTVIAFAPTPQGGMWVGTTAGLARFEGGTWTAYPQSGLPFQSLSALAVDGRGHLWVATRQGLHRYDGQMWETQTAATHDLPGDRVYDLLTDDAGNLWIGTANGLQHLDVTTGARNTYDEVPGAGTYMPVTYFRRLATGPDGALWMIATSQSVFESRLVRLRDGEWTVWETPSTDYLDLLVDAGGFAWLGESYWARGGLVGFDGTSWTHATTSNAALPGESVQALAQDARGHLWAGVYNYAAAVGYQEAYRYGGDGLVRYDGTHWLDFSHVLPDPRVQVLQIAPDSTLWVGTLTGLAVGTLSGLATGTATEAGAETPGTFALGHNYPNPFNPATTLTYTVPHPAHVTIRIFDLLGRLVATLADAPHAAGRYEVQWQAEGVASGTYVCRLEAGGTTQARLLVLAK